MVADSLSSVSEAGDVQTTKSADHRPNCSFWPRPERTQGQNIARINQQLGVIACIFVLLPCLYFNAAAQQSQSSPRLQPRDEHLRQVVDSLPVDNNLRFALERGSRGKGVRYPWMDEMNRLGIRQAAFRINFTWCEKNKSLDITDTKYLSEYYRYNTSISEASTLKEISERGLQKALADAVLIRATTDLTSRAVSSNSNCLCGTLYLSLLDDEILPILDEIPDVAGTSEGRCEQRSIAAKRNLPQTSDDIGARISFSTLDRVGNKCVMVYGGPSLRQNGFLIQDCGGNQWSKWWDYDNGFIKRMSFLNERTGWFVIGGGLVRVEKVAGQFEATAMRPNAANIDDVFFYNEQYGWICGEKGLLEKTEDGGATWTSQESGTDLNLTQIKFTNALEGWATGGEYRAGVFQGVLLTTRNGGATWEESKSKEAHDLSPVFFTSPTHGCGVNDDNAILCTNDGNTWRTSYADRRQKAVKRDMVFVNEMQGWVVGDGIWHTDDGGRTWQQQLTLPKTNSFDSVVFVSETLGWARTLDGVWRTRDGGETWTRISDSWLARMKEKGLPKVVSMNRD